MFKRLKTYNVYIKKDTDTPLETAVFVPEGFSLWAFIFKTLWAFYHRMWSLMFLFISAELASFHLMQEGLINPALIAVTHLTFVAILASEANAWRGHKLSKQGYILYDVVIATGEDEAYQRFLDNEVMQRYVFQTPKTEEKTSNSSECAVNTDNLPTSKVSPTSL